MKRIILSACGLATAGVVFVASALPAFGSESGTINATITVMAPCITVSPSTPVEFESLPFSTATIPQHSLAAGMAFDNCSTAFQQVLVRGTDASGSTASWELIPEPASNNPCEVGVNTYALAVSGVETTAMSLYSAVVTKTNASFTDMATGGTKLFGPLSSNPLVGALRMPCTGSGGAGEEMSFQIVLTATF